MSDTNAMGRLREELERKALESASGWFNSAPEMALALVRVANEVRAPVSFEPMMSEREVVQEFRNLASGTEPDAHSWRALVELLNYWRQRDETPVQCLARLLAEVKAYRELRASGVVP